MSDGRRRPTFYLRRPISLSAYYGINDLTYGEMVIIEDAPAASVDARAIGQIYERDGGAAREART